jgi:pyruvate dehydrogenase E2 component (dihydrolipoamide acetyltransferase)
MIKEILLPDLGEGIDSAEVSDVFVSPGKTIKVDDIILVLESEKASMEIPAEIEGKVKKVLIAPGSNVTAGQCLITVETTGKKTFKQKVKEKREPSRPATIAAVDPKKQRKVKQDRDGTFASPGVRRLSRELKIDLQTIKGTGPKGRVTKEDIHSFIRNKMEGFGGRPYRPGPEIDFSQWGKIATQKLTKIKGIVARRMQQSWQTIPHVTQFDEADITDLRAHRQKLNKDAGTKKQKVTFLPFFMKTVAELLKEMPTFNSSLDYKGENLIFKHYFHIGFAVDTPAGLMVPVVRDVDQKNIIEISTELQDLSQRARDKKLKPSELKGGTFTISSLGGIGGTFFTPIIDPPQVAILGISESWWEKVYDHKNETTRLRYLLPFSLSYDHRVIDGAAAARFTSRYAETLASADNYK